MMKIHSLNIHLILTAILTLSAAAICPADDGFIGGISGNVRLMKKDCKISMLKEDVKIWPIQGKVTAFFIFKNFGPEVDAEIGFPESGDHRPESSDFNYFKSWVNGKRI